MTHFNLIPGPPAGGGFGQTIILPPPSGPPGSPPCACADMSAVWYNMTNAATAIIEETTYPAFALLGTICPGSTYDVAPEWDPDSGGADPVVYSFGNPAWAVIPLGTGILTLTVTVHCGGITTVLDPIVLTIITSTYTSSCPAPTDFTSIIDLSVEGCITINFVNDPFGAYYSFGTFDTETSIVTEGDVPAFYDNVATDPSKYLSFNGLAAMFTGFDMEVRVTIIANDMTNPSYPTFIDNRNSGSDDVSAGQIWTYTVLNADIADYITGAGTGDGAGGTSGAAQFLVEVRAV